MIMSIIVMYIKILFVISPLASTIWFSSVTNGCRNSSTFFGLFFPVEQCNNHCRNLGHIMDIKKYRPELNSAAVVQW